MKKREIIEKKNAKSKTPYPDPRYLILGHRAIHRVVIGKVVGDGDLKVAPALSHSALLQVRSGAHHFVAGL